MPYGGNPRRLECAPLLSFLDLLRDSLRFRWLFCLLGLALLTLAGDSSAADSSPIGPVLNPRLKAQGFEPIWKLKREGSYREAQRRIDALLPKLEKEYGPLSFEVAVALDEIVSVGYYTGRISEPRTESNIDRALAIKRELLGPDHPEIALSLNLKAILLGVSGRRQEARPLYEEALRIRQKSLGRRARQTAESLMNLSTLHTNLGDYEKALPLAEEALDINREVLGPDNFQTANTANSVALLALLTGDYGRARERLEESLSAILQAHGPDHPFLATILTNLMTLVRRQGDRREALEQGQEALRIALSGYGSDHSKVATLRGHLAELYLEEGLTEKAGELARASIAGLEEAYGAEFVGLEEPLAIQGQVEASRGNLEKARETLQRALAIGRKAHPRGHPNTAETLFHLGLLEASATHLAIGRDYLAEALEQQRKFLGDHHPKVASTLVGLGTVVRQLGDPETALGIAFLAEAIGRQHLLGTLRSLPEREALSYAASRASGLDLLLTLSVETTASKTTASKTTASKNTASKNTASNNAALENLGPFPQRIWEAVARSRALVLDEMAQRHRHPEDPATAQAFSHLATARNRLARLVMGGPNPKHPERYLERLDRDIAAKESAERALAKANSDFRQEQETRQITWPAVAAKLPRGTALVSWVRFRRLSMDPKGNPSLPRGELAYLALVGTVSEAGASKIELVPFGNGTQLEAAITAWRAEVATPPPILKPAAEAALVRYRKAAEELRRQLWDPLVPHLGNSQQVFLVPDGLIFQLSLPTLATDSGAFLVESGPQIHLLSAEREILARPKRPTNQGLLALAAPDFDSLQSPSPSLAASLADLPLNSRASQQGEEPAFHRASSIWQSNRSTCREFQDLGLAPLPASREEAQRISQLWDQLQGEVVSPLQRAHRLLGSSAHEANFKALAPKFRALHLATHGFFVGENCSPLFASGGKGQPLSPSDGDRRLAENPLLLSGLALAGFNRREEARPGDEDGVLTAEEIASLDLSGVERVVLSACGTGLGPVQGGEGVLGLQRAFEIAGVSTLVMSLWEVEDAPTRGWMEELYQAWGLGFDTSRAVQEASLRSLQSRRRAGLSPHPFYWGAFVGVGDWR